LGEETRFILGRGISPCTPFQSTEFRETECRDQGYLRN
jgi:hypothetical protein